MKLACIVLPGTSAADLEQELRDALGPGDYELEIVAAQGRLRLRDGDGPAPRDRILPRRT